MKASYFYGYFDSENKPSYVKLRVANIYGYMETGKTTLTRKIGARIEERCHRKGWGFLYVEGRRQQDVLYWLEEHRDEVRSQDYVILAYDDAGRFFMSREGTTRERRETLKDYMEIRHKLEEMGFRRGILTVLFNIQFYRLLDKTMRNAPMSIWKSIVLMDPEERKEFVARVGRRHYYFLKVITKAMFIENYRLRISDIKVRIPSKREEIYNWLCSFFEKYGIDPTRKIDSQFVKRFALVELFDDKFIIDTGNDISIPKNFIKIDPPRNDEEWWLPRDREERDKMLFTASISYKIMKELNGKTTVNTLMKSLRKTGLSFKTKRFLEIMKLAEEIINEEFLEEILAYQ